MIYETNEGFSLEFPDVFDYVAKDIKNKRIWEPRTTEFLKSILKPGMTFLDVGAQMGYYTILARKLGAKVTAIEPSKVNREFLSKNLKANGIEDVVIYGKALSNKTEEVKLYTGKTPGENSIARKNDKFEMVETIPYDDLSEGTPDIIKMDIEGAEQSALEGMMNKVLKTDKVVYLILEDWYNNITDWLIDEHGFKLITTDRASGNRFLVKNADPFLNNLDWNKQEPLTIHLLGQFNTPTTMKPEGSGNAFSTKTVKMAKILKELGHHVIFYGVEGSEVECDEFVQVLSKETLVKAYGPWDPETVYPCIWGDYAHRMFNKNVIAEINQRKRFGDFLLCTHGTYQKPIAEAVRLNETVEIGVGYTGSFAKFRVFESQFQMNWSYGAEGKSDGDFYNCVIPGYFDPLDFTYSAVKEDYYLYLGRVIQRKGVLIARDVCKHLGKKLIVAGFGDKGPGPDGETFKEIRNDPNVEYVGFADVEKRRQLLSKAKAVFMPTTYLEPFGYVAIEAGFSGTPVITTDFGAFPETVEDGINGYRCRTFKEFVNAVKNIEADNIKSSWCRGWAMGHFTMEAAVPKYKRFFDQILDLYGKGWYKV